MMKQYYILLYILNYRYSGNELLLNLNKLYGDSKYNKFYVDTLENIIIHKHYIHNV